MPVRMRVAGISETRRLQQPPPIPPCQFNALAQLFQISVAQFEHGKMKPLHLLRPRPVQHRKITLDFQEPDRFPPIPCDKEALHSQ